MTDPVEVRIVPTIDQIGETDWDACAHPSGVGRPIDPFTTYRFLHALETSGSVGEGTGWAPRYMHVLHGTQTIAVAPMYVKSHSQGEYIFDHNWAHAYENAGGNYYPKLQIAVPFTPASGRRFLTRDGFESTGISALIQGVVQLGTDNDISSAHITFCTQKEAEIGQEIGLLSRASQQFHWLNDGYDSFDDFLASLSSRKRKNIRKERASAHAFGGEIEILTGDDIRPEHWDAFWVFYQDTGARKWGTPYLTRAFFNCIQADMRDDVVLMLAKDGETYVAGALNFIGADTLYGRYWGCVRDIPCMHFELCYYAAIEYAIDNKLSRVEAGAQGHHKLARGYLPVTTHSLHWIRDDGFRSAIAQYLDEERKAVDHENEILTSYGPFKRIDVQETD